MPAGACVLPRSRLLYGRVDLTGIPRAQWRETVQIELELNAPFERLFGWVQWNGSMAEVWYWPGTLQDQIAEALGDVVVMPETALWPRLAPGQYRLVDEPSSQTHVLQYQHPTQGLYEKRELRSISESDATAWLTRHQATVEGELAAIATPVIDESSEVCGESLTSTTSLVESRVLPGLAALLVLVIAILSVANLRATWEISRLQSQQAALESRVQETMAKRDEVRRITRFNAAVGEFERPSHVVMAQHIGSTFALDDTTLRWWTYRNGQLSLYWEKEPIGIDAATIIRELEADPGFRNVQAQVRTEQNSAEVQLDLTPSAINISVASEASDD